VRVGRSIALALGAAGARVAVHYHGSSEAAEETCRLLRELGSDALPLQADLSQPQQARQLANAVIEQMGGIDILVASAANFERVSYDQITDAHWQRALALNTTAPMALVGAAAASLRQRRGSVVLITCSSTQIPMRNYLPYVVSKGATRQLMRALALELAPEVRVNAVAPGTVLPPDDMSAEAVSALAARIPLATATFVTGQELFVDGGRALAGFERFD
jgi:pteridine reductase